ncbi:MAG: hypothetical protein AAF533_21685 [Acidobacteriota bacterium]
MTRVLRLAASAVVMTFLFARFALSCQLPDSGCSAATTAPMVVGESVEITYSVTNGGVDETSSRLDDLDWTIRALARPRDYLIDGTGEGCSTGGIASADFLVEPSLVDFRLDDAWSSAADEPVRWSGTFRVTPLMPVDDYVLEIIASSADRDGDGAPDRICRRAVCLRPPPSTPELAPQARIEPRVLPAEAGETVSFDIHVQRNDFPETEPLIVRVWPRNPGDPEDLFPLEPVDVTSGFELGPGESVVSFDCHVHGPCFAGVTNEFLVGLYDADERWLSQTYEPATVLVRRSPLAMLELLSIEDASGDGFLNRCESALVTLRLIARNPWLDAPIEDVRLGLTLPDGVSLESAELHFHDNPMDDVEPSGEDYWALGTVEVVDGELVVMADTPVEPRFWRGPVIPVFRDLFEADVKLRVPGSLLVDVTELRFNELKVDATVSERPLTENSRNVVLPVGAALPPREVSPGTSLEPLRISAERGLSWEDLSDEGVVTYDVVRGVLRDGAANDWSCVVSELDAPSFLDGEVPIVGEVWAYLVRAEGCEDLLGPFGVDSLGEARIAVDCP